MVSLVVLTWSPNTTATTHSSRYRVLRSACRQCESSMVSAIRCECSLQRAQLPLPLSSSPALLPRCRVLHHDTTRLLAVRWYRMDWTIMIVRLTTTINLRWK